MCEIKLNQIMYGDNRENAYISTVNVHGCLGIKEHRAQGEGDKWYYDIEFKERTVRVFDPIEVIYNTR